MRFHLLLLVLAGLLAFASSASPWDGQFTDNGGYGGSQYLCSSSDGTKLYGAWSESGVLVGTFTNNQRNVTGTWYEAGVGPCFSGSFSWFLDPSGSSFTGTFSCASQPALTYFVSETRLSSSVPTADQCALLATNANVNGEWVSNDASPLTTDICVSGTAYQASYSFTVTEYHGTGHAYETGQAFQNGAIAAGYSETAAGIGAVSITFRSSSGNLVSFKWAASAPHQHRAKNAPASAHQVVTSTSSTTKSHSCGENAYIFKAAYGASERSMPVIGALLVLVSALVVFAF